MFADHGNIANHGNAEDHNAPPTTSSVFVPESEHLHNIEVQPHFEPQIGTQPPTIPTPHWPLFCSINLKQGCYKIKYRPNSDIHVYNGTFRVDNSDNGTIISGDLYQFLNPIIRLPAPFSELAEDVTERVSVIPPFPHILFEIPVYPRRQYYSYLKVIGIQINRQIGQCNIRLTVEEYL